MGMFLSNKQNQQELQTEFGANSKDHDAYFRSDHSFYGFQSGRVVNRKLCSKYKIDNPDSEVVLQDANFYFKDASTCFKEKSIQIFFQKDFSPNDLEDTLYNYTTKHTKDGDKYLSQYKSKAKQRINRFASRFNTSNSDAYGCCLVLSYYTGVYSERVSRNSNIILKLEVISMQSKIQGTEKFKWMKCISYWMFKALHYIPLYWGQVTRCIQLKQGEDKIYETGNIVTWIQFSSSSYGEPTDYFKDRNTRFIIYSLSGRNIEQFSNYGNQTEVLFRPFTHFLVLHRQHKEGKLFIYMREIFFGQSSKNILWVDDNIFNKDWENKKLMERALLKDPLLNIIPKISTETAMAFIKSPLSKNRKSSEFRIMSDMTRKNENPSENAGARFVQRLLPIYNNLKVLIFTSNKTKGEKYLEQLQVTKNKNIEVTVSIADALKFLSFQ